MKGFLSGVLDDERDDIKLCNLLYEVTRVFSYCAHVEYKLINVFTFLSCIQNVKLHIETRRMSGAKRVSH